MNRRAWVVLLILTLAGCGSGHPVSRAPNSSAQPTAGFPLTVTDGLGRSVYLGRRPERIVSLSPAATETLFAVGAGTRVVAVTSVDNYPAEVESLPRVGGFNPRTVSVETLVAQNPDLVVCDGKFHQTIVEALAPLGLTVLALEGYTLEQVVDNVRLVGRVVGEPDRGEALAANLLERMARVRQQGSAMTGKQRPRVFYMQWDEPLIAAGPKSYIGQIIRDAGGDNIFADSEQFFPIVSDEVVIHRNPDLILAPTGLAEEAVRTKIPSRPGWSDLEVVKAHRFAFIAEDLVSRPGPRLIEGMEQIALAIRSAR